MFEYMQGDRKVYIVLSWSVRSKDLQTSKFRSFVNIQTLLQQKENLNSEKQKDSPSLKNKTFNI